MNNHKSRILATIVAVISTVATAVADGWNAYEIEFRVAPGMGTVFMVQ